MKRNFLKNSKMLTAKSVLIGLLISSIGVFSGCEAIIKIPENGKPYIKFCAEWGPTPTPQPKANNFGP